MQESAKQGMHARLASDSICTDRAKIDPLNLHEHPNQGRLTICEMGAQLCTAERPGVSA